MPERPASKPEIASQKRTIKLPPAIGDWTTYRPPKALVKKIKTGLYGFDRLSKEELNQALIIHYDFTQELLERFKVDLGLGIEFYSVQIEQITYLNFLRTLSGQLVQGELAIPGLHDRIQQFLELNLANSIINHALGSRDLEPLNRGLTEAEKGIVTTAITEYLPHYVAAFAGTFDLPVYSVISSPDVTLAPSINTSSTFVAFSAEIALGDNPPGKIIFGYQGSTLKKLLAKYNEKINTRPLNVGKLPPAVLNQIKIDVAAILGKTTLTTSDLHTLEVGDVVSLESSIKTAATLAIGNFLKLLVQPGQTNKKRSVRIAGFETEDIKITPPQIVSEEKTEKPAPTPEPAPISAPEIVVPAPLPLPKEDDLFDEEFSEDDFEEDFLGEEETEENKEEM